MRNEIARVAALFVEAGGVYADQPGVDVWDISRDARTYPGSAPVVAHPPCQRWGRYWHGSPRKPHQYQLGDDEGCFGAALTAVRSYGGVLEHPAYSRAFGAYGLPWAPREGWWPFRNDEWVCHVEQGHYGHMARKATWLFAVSACKPADLIWGPAEQRLPQIALDRYGYEKARRTGVMAYIGGKDKSKVRAATPAAFRDVLLSIARTAC